MSAAEPEHQAEAVGRLHVSSSEMSRTSLHGHSREALWDDVTHDLVECGGFVRVFVSRHDRRPWL